MIRSRNPAERMVSQKSQRLIRLAGLPVKASYTPKEVALILDIGWRTVYTMMQDGRLPAAPDRDRPARIAITTLAAILDPEATLTFD